MKSCSTALYGRLAQEAAAEWQKAAEERQKVVRDTKPYVVEVDYPHMGHQSYEFWTRRLAFDLFDVERRDFAVILTFPREVAR